MNKKGLGILLRTRMRHPSADSSQLLPTSTELHKPGFQAGKMDGGSTKVSPKPSTSHNPESCFNFVRNSMHSVITIDKPGVLDPLVNDFSEGYYSLSLVDKQKLLVILARDYYFDRMQVRELLKQYLSLELPTGDNFQQLGLDEESSLSAFYRAEINLRHALKPIYESLFEKLNMHPGGLKFLSDLRADILSILANENIGSLKALDSYLKEKLAMCITPAALQLHRITWDDPASLLEKIVAYEAVHPISSLIDLKRRLGVGRLCYGYLHPAIPGEPLIFIEVALLKNVAQSIKEVLWDDPPIPESQAKCALFYSISSTQRGLAGINLGKFLIKRVIELVKRDTPHIYMFATLSPIPGFMQWLLTKLVSQSKLSESDNVDGSHSFHEKILQQEEETIILAACSESAEKSGMEVMLSLLMSEKHEWAVSSTLAFALKAPLMRLCCRYLLHEKKRGKALDSVANFHLQNGAEIERINWMADRSAKGLLQSGGIMVNYVYRFENIEKNAEAYFNTGQIKSPHYLYQFNEETVKTE